MKHKRFFSILTVAVVLSLLMIAIPVTPALAATVTLNPEVGQIGDKINIEGAAFAQNQGLQLCFSSQQADTTDTIDIEVTAYQVVKRVVTYGQSDGANAGKFATTFNVPSELKSGEDYELVHGGTYYIYVSSENSDVIYTVDKFTVIGIQQLTPSEGAVGTRVTIEGVAFDDEEDISLQYDGVGVPIASGDSKTDSDGDFSCKIDIPPSTAGIHTITAKVKEIEGAIPFTVVPTITINPPSGGANDELTVTGTGFGKEFAITITFDGDEMVLSGDDETDEYGSFESTFIIPPEVEPGTYEIRVEDDDGNTAEAEFGITTNLILSSGTTSDSPGYVGMTLTISGTGFIANWPITITYASEPVTFAITSEADGSFSYTFTVPPSEAGVHIITATDGEHSAETRFFIESTPPESPAPLLPEIDTKASSKTEFDWADVSDDSLPMSYELQVATNSQFTEDSIVLYKIALTTSNYTLTGEEELESLDEDAFYYWRVRAKDAASNASSWTSGSAFTVGSSFHMPGWLIYTLIAIGVVGVFFLGIWLGRRSAGSEDYYY